LTGRGLEEAVEEAGQRIARLLSHGWREPRKHRTHTQNVTQIPKEHHSVAH
jgi:hypothetical protein